MTLVAYESFLMLSFGIQSVLDGRPESSHCCLMSSKTSSVVLQEEMEHTRNQSLAQVDHPSKRERMWMLSLLSGI